MADNVRGHSLKRMSYRKFTLQTVVEVFGLKTEISDTFFDGVDPVKPSLLLSETLEETIPLALAIGTEKARSELIVMPVLVEIRRAAGRKISIFSGIEFNVDASLGLKGFCDFLISRSEEQYVLRRPVISVVEAKKGEIDLGMGQCSAEMAAARIFNEKTEKPVSEIYGAVTTGSAWKFLRLRDNILFIQADETSIEHIDMILGIFLKMIDDLDSERGNSPTC